MLTVGLTGGIGSGKTFCARVFEWLGVAVYYADAEAKGLMQDDPLLKEGLIGLFGRRSYYKNGRLNRNHLAKQIFNDAGKMERMNAMVHPRVRQHFMEWGMARAEHPYIIQESAILFETGAYHFFDRMILVDAPESLRIERVKDRDGLSEEAIRERMDNQWPSSQKKPLAHYQIDNGGHLSVLQQIRKIHTSLLAEAEVSD